MRLVRIPIASTLLLAMLASACGPSTREQTEERVAAVERALAADDLELAQAELDEALRLRADQVPSELQSLVATRIEASEAFALGEQQFAAKDYLAAIAAFERASELDATLASRLSGRTADSERAFVDDNLSKIEELLAASDAVGAYEVFAETRAVFPENSKIDAVAPLIAGAYLPQLAVELDSQLLSESPEAARDQIVDTLFTLKVPSDIGDELRLRAEQAVTDAIEARRVAAQAERERVAAEQRAAREAEEQERRAVFDRITCVRDDLERIRRCYDRATYTRTPVNRIYLWTYEEDNGSPRLQLGLQTTGSNWIFWERARVYVGNSTYDINAGYFNIRRDNSGRGTWETFSRRTTSSDLAMFQDIARSSEAFVRFINDDNMYREHKLSRAQISAIGNMLAYWNEVS